MQREEEPPRCPGRDCQECGLYFEGGQFHCSQCEKVIPAGRPEDAENMAIEFVREREEEAAKAAAEEEAPVLYNPDMTFIPEKTGQLAEAGADKEVLYNPDMTFIPEKTGQLAEAGADKEVAKKGAAREEKTTVLNDPDTLSVDEVKV